MIQALLLLALTASAEPKNENTSDFELSTEYFITYQKLSPGAQVAYIPSLSEKHHLCVFAFVVETQDSSVNLDTVKIAYDGDDVLHSVPTGKLNFPKTEGRYTWHPFVLKRNIAIIKTESHGKSGRVIMSRDETGECSFSQI